MFFGGVARIGACSIAKDTTHPYLTCKRSFSVSKDSTFDPTIEEQLFNVKMVFMKASSLLP